MGEILSAARFSVTWRSRGLLLAAIGGSIVALLTVRELCVTVLGADAVLYQVVAWSLWLTWLAVVFPRSRARSIEVDPANAYRRALVSQVVPGFAAISAINFAPTAGRLVDTARDGDPGALLDVSPLQLAASLVLVAAGLGIVLGAVRSIGLPAAAFVEEYRLSPPPQRATGTYAVIRHPICVGGMLTAAAAAVVLRSNLALVAVNLAMLTAYAPLEDLRLRKVFGSANESYVRSVRRFVPWPTLPGPAVVLRRARDGVVVRSR